MRRMMVCAGLLVAFAAWGEAGFTLSDHGVTGGGRSFAWTELLAVRSYERAPQKFRTSTEMEVKLRVRTATKAELDFTDRLSGALIPATLTLDGTYLRFAVEAGDIVEPQGACWRVMNLEIAPTLLSLAADANGTYLLPLFSGAVVPSATEKPLKSVDRFYMQQNEWEKFGVFNAFGVSTARGSILGIVHGGEFRAWCETVLDPVCGARQSAVIGIREDPADVIEHERKEVLFRVLPDAKDYTGLALAYRDYLLRERELTPLVERERLNPALRKVMESLRFNVFLGMKNAPFRPDGSSAYFNSTTFAETDRILTEARAAGLSNCWVTLVGWIKEGHDGSYPSHFPVNAAAGSEAELRALLSKIRGWGWPVTPHDNIHSLYTASVDFDASVAARTRAGEMQSIGLWSGGLCNLACPELWMARYGGDIRRIRDLGFGGVYYIDALATGLLRCYDPRHPSNERAFALGQARVLGYARNLNGVAATENPAAYLLKYIDYGAAGGSGDRVWQRRLLEGGTKEMMEKGRFVPFYLAATHGIIATQCGWIHGYADAAGILPLFVDGAVPAVEVCMRMGAIGDYYASSIQKVLPAYKIYYETAPDLVTGLVTEFEEYAPDCVRYRYDNGLEVKVNATAVSHAGLAPYSLSLTRDGQTLL